MVPKKATKAVSAKRASPRRSTPTAKKAAGSPSKVTKKSPAKKTTTRAATASKKSPSKFQSPAKTAAKSTPASASTRAKTAAKPTTKATKVTKTAKKPASAKRTPKQKELFIDGMGDYYADYLDRNRSIEDIIAEIGRRRLTKYDKELIQCIEIWQDAKHKPGTDGGMAQELLARMTEDVKQGKMLDCHSKLYGRLRWLMPPEEEGQRVGEQTTPSDTDDEGDVVESIEEPARPSPAKGTSKATKTTTSKSPAKSAARGKSASPTKPAARGKSASPTKSAPRGKSMSPVKASPTKRTASKSPTKASTRSKSMSPVKTTMTRPMPSPSKKSTPKPPSRATKISKKTSESRYRANDDYGELMRKLEHEGYILAKHGSTSSKFRRAAVTPEERMDIDEQDADYARAKGVERAAEESSMREQATQGEQYPPSQPDPDADQVDENGVALNQRTVGRPRATMTRPTASPSPNKASSRGTPGAARRSPSKAPAAKPSDMKPLPPNKPSSEGHGKKRSPTNPEFLTRGGKPYKKNTFFETMPVKEVWHRNMPAFFSFGETPYMERIVSQQIEEDLSRTHENTEDAASQKSGGWWSGLFGGKKTTAKPAPRTTKDPAEEAEDKVWSMWNMPDLTKEELASAQRSKGRYRA